MDDKSRAEMALKFGQRALAKGHDVTAFLRRRGCAAGPPKLPQHVDGMSDSTPRQMLQAFIAKGGPAIVCPIRQIRPGSTGRT